MRDAVTSVASHPLTLHLDVTRCLGTACSINGKPYDHVVVKNYRQEVADSFCYLGDTTMAVVAVRLQQSQE